MKPTIRSLLLALALGFAFCGQAAATNTTWTTRTGTQGGTLTFGAFAGCGGLCAANVPIDVTGAPLFSSTNAGFVQFPSVQAVTQSGTWTMRLQDGSGNAITSTSNNLNVQCANCSGSGVSAADEATFTASSSLFAPAGGFFQTTATANPLTSGKQGMAQMTAQRALFANLRDATGTELGTAASPLRSDPTGTTTQPVSLASVPSHAVTNAGTFAVQNTAALPAGTNVIGHVICDSGCSSSGGTSSSFGSAMPSAGTAVGLYDGTNMVRAKGDETNGIWVNVKSATGVSQAATTSGTTFSPIGAGAVNAEQTAVGNGQLSRLVTDLVGKLIVLPYANPENFVSGAITSAMTGTTSTSLLSAPASGLRNYITSLVCSNSHATVGTDIVLQDGSGGTTLMTIPAAASYGGATITLPTPLRQPTTATAIFVANVTTGASTKCSAVGYKGA